MSNWMRLGFFLSITWIAGVSFIYFDELANYPSYATRIGSMYLDTSFGWEKDVEKTHEAHVDAINRDEDFSYDAFFLKPIFNISGYFRLILLPIILIWLIMFLMNIFIWGARREILAKIKEKFQMNEYNPLKKYLLPAFLFACVLVLYIAYLVQIDNHLNVLADNEPIVTEKKTIKITRGGKVLDVLHDSPSKLGKSKGKWKVLGVIGEDYFEKKDQNIVIRAINKVTSMLLPIFIGCFILWLGSILVWTDRHEIMMRLTKRLREIDPLVKLFIFIAIIMSCSLIYLSNVPEPVTLFSLCFICIPTVWFCVKKVVYDLVYAIMKAFGDAKKEQK